MYRLKYIQLTKCQRNLLDLSYLSHWLLVHPDVPLDGVAVLVDQADDNPLLEEQLGVGVTGSHVCKGR